MHDCVIVCNFNEEKETGFCFKIQSKVIIFFITDNYTFIIENDLCFSVWECSLELKRLKRKNRAGDLRVLGLFLCDY